MLKTRLEELQEQAVQAKTDLYRRVYGQAEQKPTHVVKYLDQVWGCPKVIS